MFTPPLYGGKTGAQRGKPFSVRPMTCFEMQRAIVDGTNFVLGTGAIRSGVPWS